MKKIYLSTILVFIQFLSFSQDSVTYYSKLYNKYADDENHQKAITCLEKLLELKRIDSTNYPYLVSNLAGHLMKVKDYKSAMGYYNFAIKLKPDESDFYSFRGDLKCELEDYRGAIRDYNKSIDISESFKWETFAGKARAQRLLERYVEAISNYSRAIEILEYNYEDKPFMADFFSNILFYYRGICQYEIRNFDEACLDWSKAGELGVMEAYDFIKKHCN